MRLPLALSLAGLGYLLAVPSNLDDPLTIPLLLLAASGAFVAAAAQRHGVLVAGVGLLAAARTLQATKGTLIGNWPFALPAWVMAAGLVAAFLAFRAERSTTLPFALAALGTGAIAAWLASRGDVVACVGALLTCGGYALAALPATGTAAAPAPAEAR